MTAPRPAVLFFPHKATVQQVKDHIEALRDRYPDCLAMMSVPHDRRDLRELAQDEKLFDWCVFEPHREARLVSRAMTLLSRIVFYEDVHLIALNTAMIRYAPDMFLSFFTQSMESQIGNLLVGEPLILHPDKHQEIKIILEDQNIRRSLMIDVATSYLACRTNPRIFSEFCNLNAGLFAIRTDNQGVRFKLLASILSRAHLPMRSAYHDSDLAALMFALCMGEDLSLKKIFVTNIDLTPLRGDYGHLIRDLHFLLDTLFNAAKPIDSDMLVAELFDEKPYLKVIFDRDRQWFREEVLGMPAPDTIKPLPGSLKKK